MRFANSYAQLPEAFFARVEPRPVREPRIVLWNTGLARALGLDEQVLGDRKRRARVFSGNERLAGMEPIALAYAGHQFGHFVPSLGDGRAHLLGEIIDPEGQRRDLQLKGSGPTPYSRGGDGRCGLGPAVREFIMSEALFALGIPTTRSLTVVATGEPVMRNPPQPGAVVTRVASSHLRVGTFQYFAARHDVAAVRRLLEYAIDRHFPDIDADEHERPIAFLQRVCAEQLETVMHWMRVGFIHGVMNTDNTTISGETIDYGPCAMMNAYDPATVFSSIDHPGRYAFGNQPKILVWNMVRLAECLLPLVDDDESQAIAAVKPMIEALPAHLESGWIAMMASKIGFEQPTSEDATMVADLLGLIHERKLDYTNTFARLTELAAGEVVSPPLDEGLEAWDAWVARWLRRLDEGPGREAAATTMRKRNPVVIPRNHHVEAALAACVDAGDTGPTERLLAAVREPYHRSPQNERYRDPPEGGDAGYQTFCGT